MKNFKKAIKEFFNLKTKTTEFKSTIISNIIVYIVIGIAVALSTLIKDKELSSIFMLLFIVIFLYFFWVFIIKIIVISENRRLATVRSNKYNLKYPTINVYTSDLNVWFTKATETETIHVKSKENIFHSITVEVLDENVRNY